MRRKLGLMFILLGLLFAGWNGYYWVAGSFSGREAMADNDIVKADEAENINLKQESNDSASLPIEESQTKQAAYIHEKETPLSSETTKKTERKEEPTERDYEEYEKGAEVGWLLIPALNMKYPIYWGTDDETLTQGVGYHVGDFTTPPDGLAHTVLSGHRDTVFRELGELDEGAKMYIQFEDMQYEYELKKTWITDAQDRTVIVDKDKPTLTLTTCYPFNFIGSAPDRYIIESHLVNMTEMPS